jgi:predicted RNA binding protein YcfA (HicA-like mRNA interferase family)
MKLPRNESGASLVKRFQRLGYSVTRQTGSHIRMTTQENGEHHITIPDHQNLKVGALNSILTDVAQHFNITRDELIAQLW